jgi:hypothetical protein
VVRFIGIVAILCFALQAVALGKAGIGGNHHCVVAPIPDCEAAIWGGYVVLLDGAGRKLNLAGVLARFVPLFMWMSVVMSLHAPSLTMKRAGKKTISPGGWIYGALFLAIAGYSAMNMTSTAPARSAPAASAPGPSAATPAKGKVPPPPPARAKPASPKGQ